MKFELIIYGCAAVITGLILWTGVLIAGEYIDEIERNVDTEPMTNMIYIDYDLDWASMATTNCVTIGDVIEQYTNMWIDAEQHEGFVIHVTGDGFTNNYQLINGRLQALGGE